MLSDGRIIGVMATFPARLEVLKTTLPRAASLVDRLRLVMNEMTEIPDWINDNPNVEACLPKEDLKDVGKFLPTTTGFDWVFMFDDDILYPEDYVTQSLRAIEELDSPRTLFGFHGTIYRRRPAKAAWRQVLRALHAGYFGPGVFKDVSDFHAALEAPCRVDQIGTGTLIARPSDVPSFNDMRDAKCRVDSALARWAFENDRDMIVLPRNEKWIKPVRTSQSIYAGYTVRFPEAFCEDVKAFAYKRPNLGNLE